MPSTRRMLADEMFAYMIFASGKRKFFACYLSPFAHRAASLSSTPLPSSAASPRTPRSHHPHPHNRYNRSKRGTRLTRKAFELHRSSLVVATKSSLSALTPFLALDREVRIGRCNPPINNNNNKERHASCCARLAARRAAARVCPRGGGGPSPRREKGPCRPPPPSTRRRCRHSVRLADQVNSSPMRRKEREEREWGKSGRGPPDSPPLTREPNRLPRLVRARRRARRLAGPGPQAVAPTSAGRRPVGSGRPEEAGRATARERWSREGETEIEKEKKKKRKKKERGRRGAAIGGGRPRAWRQRPAQPPRGLAAALGRRPSSSLPCFTG